MVGNGSGNASLSVEGKNKCWLCLCLSTVLQVYLEYLCFILVSFSATVSCFDAITIWVSFSSHHMLSLPMWAHKRGCKGRARSWIRTAGTCRSQRGCGAGGMPGLSSTTHGEGDSPEHGLSMAISLVAISLVAINLPAISLLASSSREAARAPRWALLEPFFPVLTWLLFI